MNSYIGIDLGTSGVKLLLVDAKGKIIAEENAKYSVQYPQNGWTEQDPTIWWDSTILCLRSLLDKVDKTTVKGISFGGQMHGLVVLDERDNIIRPCILWNDGRTEKEVEYLNEVIGKDKLSNWTGNIAFAGFTAPKIIWMKENEPQNFARISKIMLPKDYLAYRLSGVFCTDYSDASGTLLLDVKNKKWSKEMLSIVGINETQLPKLFESYQIVGTLKEEIARELGLSDSVKIIAGAGDNAASAIGMGSIDEGSCTISLGTSGTIFIPQESFNVDENNALHSFVHASGKWHLMGCILSAASCRSWWLESIIGTENYENDEIFAGLVENDKLFFLPYLSGERSPHNDVNARGAFIGLSANTSRAQMSRAVMEGVAFALRDCLEVARTGGITIKNATVCGGGAKSKVWRQIIADVLNLPILVTENKQGVAFGACILAMVGCGEYADLSVAKDEIPTISEQIQPNQKEVDKYNKKYEIFKRIYPAIKTILST